MAVRVGGLAYWWTYAVALSGGGGFAYAAFRGKTDWRGKTAILPKSPFGNRRSSGYNSRNDALTLAQTAQLQME